MPIHIAGIGAAGAKEEVISLAHHLKAPIVRTLRAKDWIDDDHPDCAGGLGQLGGEPGSEAMKRCDALVVIGADFPYTEFYPEDARTIQIDPEIRRLGKRVHVDGPLQGHARPTLEALMPLFEEKTDDSYRAEILGRRDSESGYFAEAEQSDDTPIRPQRLMAEISRAAPEETVFLCDTGTATAWTARHLRVSGNQRYTLSSGLGTMAFAMPGALGAQLIYPDRPVCAIAGDGGFAMLMADFVTAVRYEQMPITVVILDNAKLGFIGLEQQAKGLPEHSIDLLNPDFAAFAEACGGVDLRVTEPGALAGALEEAFSNERPTVVSVAVDPDELIMPPRIEAGQAVQFGIAKLREAIR